MKRNIGVFIFPFVLLAAAGAYFFISGERAAKERANNTQKMIVIETDKGVIKAELKPEDAPKTVKNFTDLVSRKFYDGLKFHRVVPDFVIQGGDPKGDGSGGSDATIPLEIKCQDGTMNEGKEVVCPVALSHTDGALAMARATDPDSASSQFYITLGAQKALDGKYAVFGYVKEGLEVARAIRQGDAIKKIYWE